MSDLTTLCQSIDRTFRETFGATPLRERLDDILRQAIDATRYTDLRHLREESGDLLCSVVQLCHECGWEPDQLIKATLEKVEARRPQYAGLSRRISVAILGGAFDPIHRGHIAVAKFVLNTSRAFDEVWLMPCFQHMNGKRMQSAEHRLEMCRIAAKADGRIRPFDFEIRHQFKGETYHLVKRLLADEMARFPYEFSLIIGQDNANSLPDWVNGEELMRMIRFVVVPRQGIAPSNSQTWYLRPPHLFLMAGEPLVQTSSTEVRNLIQKSDPRVETLLDAGVVEYVRTHNLYR